MRTTIKWTASCAVLALAGAGLLSSANASAQDGVHSPNGQPDPAQANDGLAEIVVTAQKRSENMQDVPVSVTALSGSQLRSLNLTNATQITQQVPNLAVQTPYGEAQPIFSLRGVSLVDYSQHQQGPIAMYVDEDYKGAGVFRSQQLYDIDHVEVLRGPQGTLFGRNTTGGSVNIYTVSPNLAGTRGYFSGGVGNYGLRETSGAVEFTPIDDVLGIRIAYDYRRNDGFIKALQPGLKNFNNEDGGGVRVKIAYHPTPDLRLQLSYSHGESKTRPTGYSIEHVGAEGIGFLGFFNENESFYSSNAGSQGYLRINNDSAQLRGEWDVNSGMTLTSLTSYDEGTFSAYSDDDDRPEKILADGVDSRAKVWSQELRLASTDKGPFTWLVGGALSQEHIETSSRYDYFGLLSQDVGGEPSCLVDGASGCIYLNAFDAKRRSMAAFAHLTYKITERLQIQGGLRYSNDRTSVDSYTADLGYFDPATGEAVLGGGGTYISAPPFHRFTNSNLSGKIALRYEIGPNVNSYASYSRGYRSGTFNGYAYFDPSEVNIVKPETIDAYEVGFKAEMLGRKIRLNGSLFYYDYTNQQFLDVDELGLENLVNAPSSRIWGGELELTAALARNLTVSASAGHTDSKFKELTLGGEDLSGNRLSSAPRWTLNGAVDWTMLPDSPASIDFHADARYTSKQYFTPFNKQDASQRGYWLVNASISKPIQQTGLRFSLWIKNLLGKHYDVYMLDDAVLNGQLAVRGAPRTYGGSATVTF